MSKTGLKLSDWKMKIERNIGEEEWVVTYSNHESTFESATFYSALIPDNKIAKSLEDFSWDLSIGDGRPGFTSFFKDGKDVNEYYRFSTSGVEPLIVKRFFNGIKKNYCEVSEEFRHYFNLFEDRSNNSFIAIDDNGDEDVVILVTDCEIKIKLKYLKEFLAVKKMTLAIFFDIYIFSEKTIEELNIKGFNKVVIEDNYIYSIGICNSNGLSNEKRKSQSWLMGKKLIAGLKDFESKLFNQKKEYEDFIVGCDKDGKEILITSNSKKASIFLRPVFFKREVLDYYYSNTEKYLVEDGCVRCGNLWLLPIDNNHPKYVVVYLGDLGQNLSIKEQRRWKYFNITPQGSGISKTASERDFKAKFSDPGRSDLYFKYKLQGFQEEWKKKYNWELFKPLPKEDGHHFKTLRIPLTNEQKEFDEQVLSLTKILIDSLNEKELVKGIKITKENAKGIDKLESFLNSEHACFKDMLKFLRNLQELRSTGVAHIKGKNYNKIKKAFLIGEKNLSDVFDNILVKAIQTLNSLESYFLKKK
jgi:hypothetical protein